VPLEELFVDGDVLDRDETPPGVVLGDGVDEERRLPVAVAVEEDGDVQHDGAGGWGLGAGRDPHGESLIPNP
jgi:hypothetical protein